MADEWPGALTQAELAAIGSVVVESSNLEHTVEGLVCRLAGLDVKQGAIFLKGMFESKLQTLSTVAEQWMVNRPELLAEIKELIREIGLNNDKRRLVVHGIWNNIDAVGTDGGLAFHFREYRATKINRVKETSQAISIDEVLLLADKIRLTDAKVRNLRQKIWPPKSLI